MTGLELLGAATGIAYVWLAARENPVCWPIGLINVVAYGWIYFETRLYADFGLQAVYGILTIYGWSQWRGGAVHDEGSFVRRLPRYQIPRLLLLTPAAAVGLGWSLAAYTDADLPYWDAITTVGSLVAQWMVARRHLESWVLWIVVDTLCVGIYAVKGLMITSGLFAVYLVLAVYGFRYWKATWSAQTEAAPASATITTP